jgi:hypothetical protein
MTRVKKVFSSVSEIVHLWAHQTQDEAMTDIVRDRGGWASYIPYGQRRASFKGTAFKSYDTVIARVVKTRDGERAYLITDHTYSVTTTQHQREVRSAIPSGAKKFVVPVDVNGHYAHPSVSEDHEENLFLFNEEVKGLVEESKKARLPKSRCLMVEAWQLHLQAKTYFDTFDCGAGTVDDFPYSDGMMAETVAAHNADLERREAARIERYRARREAERAAWEAAAPLRAAKEREEAEKRAAEIEVWRNGGPRGYNWYSLPTMLRVKDGVVETSRGANFPIDHAKRGLALVRSVIQRGEEWHTNGHTCHLGPYKIDRITSDGTVYAGCHEVRWEEIERIAAQLEAA